MPNIKLSKRLAAIASLLPPSGGLADVGTDHAYIPLWLLQNGYSDYLAATDINVAPLRRAKQSAKERGFAESIDFRLCDGLEGLDPDRVSTVVIAGLGGENMTAILAAAPWTREKLLVLQPMSKADRLRGWLRDNHYRVLSETLVDDGAVYEILTVTGGQDPPYKNGERLTGRLELICASPLFPARLEALTKKTVRALEGLKNANPAQDAAKRDALQQELESLLEMRALVEK